MTYRWKTPLLLPLLSLLLGGCEPLAERGGELPTAPEASVLALDHDASPRTVMDEEGNHYTLVEGRPSLPSGGLHVSEVIGVEGGTIELAGHRLTVPSGAVTTPTLFVLDVLGSGYVEVELFALVADPLRGVLDVGEQGFERPVTLSLTYAWAKDVDDAQRLRIVHLRKDGVAEPVPSTVDTDSRTVTARLDHFSRYCMVTY